MTRHYEYLKDLLKQIKTLNVCFERQKRKTKNEQKLRFLHIFQSLDVFIQCSAICFAISTKLTVVISHSKSTTLALVVQMMDV